MLELSLLGRLQIRFSSKPVESELTTKALALLVYLAVTGQPHSRHGLAGMFWGETSEERAKNSLRVALAALRKVAPDHLEGDKNTVFFQTAAPHVLDTFEFEQAQAACMEDDLTACRRAAELYRGDFLQDFFVDDSPAFEEWLTNQRSYYRSRALKCLARLADLLQEQGEAAEAITALQRLVVLEPWDESAHRRLMRALAKQGDFTAALAHYENLVDTLERELGLDPMPETAALYGQIQLARNLPPPELPTHSGPFYGRGQELARLEVMLADPDCRLITLVGLGGIGKTSLALEAARRTSRRGTTSFLHGVVFVSLVEVDAPSGLEATLAAALRAPHGPSRTLREDLLHFLRPRELLLVVDNLDPLVKDVPVLFEAILRQCPGIQLLATSRTPLQMAEEWRLDLDGLDFPAREDEPCAEMSAIRLFVQSARQVQPDFRLGPSNQALIGEICRALDGVPLAVKLAASWLRAYTLDELEKEIKRNLDLLSSPARDLPPRQRSIRAVFDHSWRLLSPSEKRLFAGTSIFRGGFSAAAARQVLGASPVDLAGLVDQSLMHLHTGTQWYHVHELARQYAAEKLAAGEEVAGLEIFNLRHTHAAYYATYLQEETRRLHGDTYQAVLVHLYMEADNLRQAWNFAVEQGELALLEQSLEGLFEFYLLTGAVLEGAAAFGRALECLPDLEKSGDGLVQPGARFDQDQLSRLQSRLLARQGALYTFHGEYETATASLVESLVQAERLNDRAQTAFALTWLAHCANARDDFVQAREYAARALELTAVLDDRLARARALNIAGVAAFFMQDFPAAGVQLGEALELLRNQHERINLPPVLINLSLLWLVRGEFDHAHACAAEALEITQALKSSLRLEVIHMLLGHAALARGNFEEARSAFEWGRRLAEQSENSYRLAYALDNLGELAIAEGDLERAHDLCMQSAALNRRINKSRSLAFNYLNLGEIYLAREQPAEAELYFSRSLAIWDGLAHREGKASAWHGLGTVRLLQGDRLDARGYLERALDLAQEIGAPPLSFAILVEFGNLLRQSGQAAEAAALWDFIAVQPRARYVTRRRAADLRATLFPASKPIEIEPLLESLGLVRSIE